jgi:hypothetical protein
MLNRRVFLIIVFAVYFILNCFIYIYFHDTFIGEEVSPFLNTPPKVISQIDDSGHNKYILYFNDLPPDDFTGRINKIGNFKTVVCDSNNFAYFWISPQGNIIPVMKGEGSGSLPFHIHRLIFDNRYNLGLIRMHIFLIGALIIAIMWLFCKGFFNIATANLAALILCLSLPFLNHIYMLRFSDNYAFLFSLLVFFTGYKYFVSNKPAYLYLCFFIAGIALYIKLTVIWTFAALLILMIGHKIKIKVRFPALIKSCLLLILGCLPILIYNIDSRAASLTSIKYKFLSGALIKNTAWAAIYGIWSNVSYFFRYILMAYPAELFLIIFAISLYVSTYKESEGNNAFKNKISFFWELSFLNLALIFISAYPGGDSYYMNMYAFFVIPEAATLAYLLQADKSAYIKKAIFMFISAILTVNALTMFFGIARPGTFSPPGGQGVKTLTRYLEDNKIYDPVCLQYKLFGVIEFESSEKIKPLHYFPLFYNTAEADKRRRMLSNIISRNPHKTFVIFTQEGKDSEPGLDDFISLINSQKTPLRIEKAIHHGVGYFMLFQPIE